MDTEPVLEDLDVPATTVATSANRPVLAVIAVLAALVGYGFFGGGEPDGNGGHEEMAAAATAAPAAAPATAGPASSGPLATVDEPADGELVRGRTLTVSGVVSPPVARVRVVASIARLTVAEETDAVSDGRYRVTLHVGLPGDGAPLAVLVRVLDAHSGRELDRRVVPVLPLSPVAVAVVAETNDGFDIEVLALDEVEGVQVEAAGTLRVEATPEPEDRLGFRRWHAALPVDAGVRDDLVVRWRGDGVEGTAWVTPGAVP